MLNKMLGFVKKRKQNLQLEAASLFLAVLCLAGGVIVMLNREWRVNDQEGLVVEQIRRTAGLWYKCTYQMGTARSCEDIDKFWAALPNAILVGRVLMIINIATTGFGVILLYMGSSFTSHCSIANKDVGYMHTARKSKYLAFIMGSLMFLVSALCVGIAVIWYMLLVTDQYFQHEAVRNAAQGGNSFLGRRYVWGSGLYFGLILIVGQLMVAGLACCSNIMSSDDEEDDYYKPLQQGVIGTINNTVRDYI